MIAAGDDPQRQIHPLGQQQVGGGDHGFRGGGMIEHFVFAVVHINGGVPADVGPGYHFQNLAGADPQTGGQAGASLEGVVVNRYTIEGDETAHGRTGNNGILPVGKGAVVFIDIGLQLLHQPVHGDAAFSLDVSVLGIGIDEGCVFHKTAVALVVALNAYNNQFFLAFLHIFCHAPGFSVGGIFVKENVVAVKHIHNGVTLVFVFLVGFGQTDINPPRLFTGKLGNGYFPFLNHWVISSKNA